MNAKTQMIGAKPLPNFHALFRDATRGVPIHAHGLSRNFGGLNVLRDLDLIAPPGQFLAIVGRSGCGKSTLLRILCGLDKPSDGRLSFGETEREASAQTRIMFQEPRLLPWARVVENVEVGLGATSSRRAARGRALESLESVGLADRADAWPSVLSGGQKQRVALARALVSRPRFLALDEPLGALDALTRIEMQSLIERVWSEQKFTAVLVTHDVAEAIMLADRVLMIENGAIALDIPIDIPRPRRRSSVDIALLEERILVHLVKRERDEPEYMI